MGDLESFSFSQMADVLKAIAVKWQKIAIIHQVRDRCFQRDRTGLRPWSVKAGTFLRSRRNNNSKWMPRKLQAAQSDWFRAKEGLHCLQFDRSEGVNFDLSAIGFRA